MIFAPDVQPLRALRGAVLHQRVDRPHTKEAWILHTEGGEWWVGKSVRTIKRSGLRAEFATTLVGHVIGAPIPDGGIAQIDEVPWWCSAFVAPADPWSDERGQQVVNLQGLASLVALDLLTLNDDRHGDNLLLRQLVDGTLEIVGIDHEQAWIGHPAAFDPKRELNGEKWPMRFAWHDGVREHLPDIAAQVAAVPDDVWLQVARTTALAVPDTAIGLLASRLAERAHRLPVFAAQHLRGEAP